MAVGCTSTAGGPPPLEVSVQTLKRSTHIDSTQYVGTLESKQRVDLAPRIQGRLLKIYVKEGDPVRRGQVLVELRPTKEAEDVRAAQGNLVTAKATLQAAEADRARAAADVAAAQAAVVEAQSNARLAKNDYERIRMTTRGGRPLNESLTVGKLTTSLPSPFWRRKRIR